MEWINFKKSRDNLETNIHLSKDNLNNNVLHFKFTQM